MNGIVIRGEFSMFIQYQMPRRPNPNAEMDKEFWLALSFISDTWNNGPQSMKTTNIEWNVALENTI